MLGHDNVDAVITTLELVSQDLATKQTLGAALQTRCNAGTARWHTGGHFILAASDWIGHAPSHSDGRRWTANRRWSWFTTGCGFAAIIRFLQASKQASVGWYGGNSHQGCNGTSDDRVS